MKISTPMRTHRYNRHNFARRVIGALCLVVLATPLSRAEEAADHCQWIDVADESANEALFSKLRDPGGYVILFRHGAKYESERYRGEFVRPENLDLKAPSDADCKKQLNLKRKGRRQARKMGRALMAREIKVEVIRASPMCRTFDTARFIANNSEFGGSVENDDDLLPPNTAMPDLPVLSDGSNAILVSHSNGVPAIVNSTLNSFDPPLTHRDINHQDDVIVRQILDEGRVGGYQCVAGVRSDAWPKKE